MNKVFFFRNQFWTIVNYDDTSGKWLCQDNEGFLRYFSKEELDQSEVRTKAGS